MLLMSFVGVVADIVVMVNVVMLVGAVGAVGVDVVVMFLML